VTVWNDSGYTERLAHANWMANTAVLMHLNERATGDPARNWLSSWAHRWFVGDRLRVLVLGCGEGWLERAVAAWPFVERIDAVDFAADAVARARALAEGIPKIHYGVIDLNHETPERNAYDVIVAHSVLHHIGELEHACDAIEAAMRPEGTLVVNEYAGPDRFQFSDDVLVIMNRLLRCLPVELNGGIEERSRPTVAEMIANDPTEAVRSADLIPMLSSRFDIIERKDIGGTILQHLLYEIVENFRFAVPRERSLLEMLCTIEAMLVDQGSIPSDFVLLAGRRRGSRVAAAARPLPPRADGAGDVEDDPIGHLGPPGPLPRRWQSRHGDWPWAFRLARLALLGRQPSRAHLCRRSRAAEWRERFRARHSSPWDWALHHAADDSAMRCLIGAAADLSRYTRRA
jgi:SAM-dependent methyltransferase